jgi:hypothetical protein
MANTTDTPKIPEMVERIAQVLKACEYDCSQWPVENLRHLATIIFRAMREPTEAMWDAGKHRCHGVPLLDGSDRLTCGGFLGETPSEQWKRMIDAALGE